MTSFSVELYVYDLSQGMAKSFIPLLLGGKQISGIWHTGVVVYGREYFFGSNGVQFVLPGGTILGHTYKKWDMGQTQIPQDVFEDYLKELSEHKFRPEAYHLLDHNCNTFSDEVCLFLVSKNIPGYITDLPNEVKNSPIGSFLKPIIDEIYKAGNQNVAPGSSQKDGAASNDNINNSSSSSSSLLVMLNEFLQQNQTPSQPRHASEQGIEQEQLNRVASSSSSHDVISKCFHEVNNVRSLVDKLAECCRSDENLLEELNQYLSDGGGVWCISRLHINLLCDRIKSRNDPGSLPACALLQATMMKEDAPSLILHDPRNTFFELLRVFPEDGKPELRASLIKCLCNLLNHKSAIDKCFQEKSSSCDLIVEFLVSCVLFCDVEVNKVACQSTSNIFVDWSKQNDDGICFKLGISLLELMQRAELSDSVHMWFSIHKCLRGSPELLAYSQVMHSEGLLNAQLNPQSNDSSEVRTLKDDIKKLLT